MIKFKKLAIFTATFFVSIVLLIGIHYTQKQLDESIKVNHLRFTGQIKNAPPLVAFTTVALGSFRGILADFLWLRAASLQDKGNYFEMVQLADWIQKLQPRFAGAASYLAWNMAYNISVTCSNREDRWRWVNEGVKLLRTSLEYNPEDANLYKELGWIFQHKMGNVLDDAHQLYKNRLALAMMRVIGSNPDWEKLAKAPVGYKAFLKKYPETKDSPFLEALKKSGIETYDKLYEDFKKKSELPQSFLTALNRPLMAADLSDYFRAAWLYDKYKLRASVINEINKDYGDLDWRLPESQAIYWATMGLRMTPSHKDISCERMITQSLFAAFKSGRVVMIDRQNYDTIVCMPNLKVVDAVLRVYDEAYLNNDKQSSFRSAKLNFMKDAIVLLYSYGDFKKSKEYYRKLRKEEPGKYRRGYMAFLIKEWSEDMKDAAVKQATNIIGGLIYSSLNYMVNGDMEKAVEHENLAKYLYKNYQKANADVKERIGLAPYKTLKAGMIQSALKSFPPMMAQILRARIEASKKAQEKKKNISRGAVIPGLSY
ncbi:MAG: hypothetical protein KAS17_02140 [Victivallaceae bacterium]|nr:hypothetical protein [Victivallaceae bacterium]